MGVISHTSAPDLEGGFILERHFANPLLQTVMGSDEAARREHTCQIEEWQIAS